MQLDTEQIREAQSGNVDSLNQLLKITYPYILKNAYNIVGDFHTAQDVAQQVAIVVADKLDNLREVKAFIGWLKAVTRTQSLRSLRARKESTCLDETAEPVSYDVSPEYSLSQAETHQFVRNILQQIPSQHRQTLEMYYNHDNSVKQIARELKVPVTTVKKRLFDGRKKVRCLLKYQ